MNVFDRIVSIVAPGWALKREIARTRLDGLARYRELSRRKYEGASNSSRLSSWLTSDSSANTEVRGAAKSLRERARDLRRNNPYAARAVQVIATNVVGDGIRPQINHDKNKESRALKVAIEKWSEWAESRKCDLEDRLTIIQMQALIMEAVVESGEIFVIRHRQPKKNDEDIVPLKLQLLEADYLDHNKNEKLSNGAFIVQGIEYDKNGKAVAYHFYKSHPGDTAVLTLNKVETIRVEAEGVAHIYRADRPHQSRGVSWFAPVMIRLRDLDVFQDATLRKQQISACFAGFITDATGELKDEDEDTVELLEKLESGTVELLPPGTDIKFPSPPSAQDYPEFTKAELRSIAAGLGITYESMTNDLSNVNFSSGRMGFIEMSRNIRRWQSDIVVAQLMDPIFLWFIEALDLVTPGNMDMSKIWTHWTKPPREMIDPSKEVPAASAAIESCQTTLSEILRSRGFDPDTVFEERARELKKLKELGVMPGSEKKTEKKPQSTDKGDENEQAEDTDSEAVDESAD